MAATPPNDSDWTLAPHRKNGKKIKNAPDPHNWTPADHAFHASITERAEPLGKTYDDLFGHLMRAGFEPDPPEEVMALVQEMHLHSACRTEEGRRELEEMERLTEEERAEKEALQVAMEEGEGEGKPKYVFVWGDDDLGEGESEEEEEEDPVTHVFAIPELFDIILSSVGTFDILRCRRVSKRFAHNILGSKTLQERLFLLPITSSDPLHRNPLAPSCITMREKTTCTNITLTSLQAAMMGPFQPTYRVAGTHPMPCTVSGSLTAFAAARALATDALWPAMFVTQPPLTAMSISYKRRGGILVEAIVRRRAGIKFEDLLQEIEGMVRKHRAAPDSVEGDVVTFEGPVEEKKRKKRSAGGKASKGGGAGVKSSTTKLPATSDGGQSVQQKSEKKSSKKK